MTQRKTPVLLTEKQISVLQSMVLEKQLELAARQSDDSNSGEFRELSEQMSHATDLLLALNDALDAKPAVQGLPLGNEAEQPAT